ncbi:MAG: helix-turn-helix transcriptional regulator [Actinobacteria bacterium]|nr:helix-turn-helix transcriptional regulator [Actinomycetota bacterium]
MNEIMETGFGPGFDQLRAKYVDTPERVAEYERTVQTVMTIRKFLMAMDGERERLGLSKAALARRIGMDPSVVRRLFSSDASNPTLKTVIEMLSALDIDVELRLARRPSPQPPEEKPRRRKRAAKPAAA